jgi:DUF971 family protein
MRKVQSERPDPSLWIKTSQEGIIVWDHKGVVVMWPDGHRSRFAWSTLRALCTCAECEREATTTTIVERNAA